MIAWYSRARSSCSNSTSLSRDTSASMLRFALATAMSLLFKLDRRNADAQVSRFARNTVSPLPAVARSSRLFLYSALFPAFFSCFFPVFRPQSLHEFVRLVFCGILRGPITMLNPSDQLLTLTVDDVDIIVGKFAPLFLDLAFVLFPFSLNLIPVHDLPPCLDVCRCLRLNHAENTSAGDVIAERCTAPFPRRSLLPMHSEYGITLTVVRRTK